MFTITTVLHSEIQLLSTTRILILLNYSYLIDCHHIKKQYLFSNLSRSCCFSSQQKIQFDGPKVILGLALELTNIDDIRTTIVKEKNRLFA